MAKEGVVGEIESGEVCKIGDGGGNGAVEAIEGLVDEGVVLLGREIEGEGTREGVESEVEGRRGSEIEELAGEGGSDEGEEDKMEKREVKRMRREDKSRGRRGRGRKGHGKIEEKSQGTRSGKGRDEAAGRW